MTVSRRKGDAGLSDILFSRIVRSRGNCQRCGKPATDTAHIVGRRYSATRCIEDNAWALCRTCHQVTGEWANEFMWLVERTISVERYIELKQQANAGTRMSSKLFWRETRERLEARCRELGLPTTWRTAA